MNVIKTCRFARVLLTYLSVLYAVLGCMNNAFAKPSALTDEASDGDLIVQIQSASASGYTWPLATAGSITQYFVNGHGGVDIGIGAGTEVLAAMGGTVKYIHNYNARTSLDDTSMNSYGNLVILYHPNGTTTYYAHMSDVNGLSVGQSVVQGQVIGHVGLTGATTGYHLHFELRTGANATLGNTGTGTRQNPLNYVSSNNLPGPMNREPLCNFEGAVGGDGQVIVQGWAFDPDDSGASIGVHIYISGPAGTGSEGYAIVADQYREDVNRAYGIGGNHGFRSVIQTDRRGELSVSAYAIDTAGGNNPFMAELKVNVTEPRREAVDTLPEGGYSVRSALRTSACLDVKGSNMDDRAGLVLYDWSGTANQVFSFSRNDDSSYTFAAKHSGKSIEIYGASCVAGDPVSQHTPNGSTAQRWWLDKNDDGTYSFRHRGSGLYIDVTAGSPDNGTPIEQWTGNGTNVQRWYLVPIDVSLWNVSVEGTSSNPRQRPAVVAGGLALEEGEDYELAFANVDDNTVQVTVIGKNGYTGSKTVTFRLNIDKKDGWVGLGDGAKGYARGGRLVTGWMDLGSSKFYFLPDGSMATGWTDVDVSGKAMRYYFNPASGNLARGTWMTIDGRKYYFRPSGNLATGWATIPDRGVDKKYYFDAEGQMLTGWQEIEVNGKAMRYYFRPSGAMATGWADIDGEKYWFRPSGNMATGFADVDDAYKRYFDESGHMLTGWQTIGGKIYYFRSSGAMQTGVATIDGTKRTFSSNGVLAGELTWTKASEAPADAVVFARKWTYDESFYRQEVASYTYYRWCSNYDGIWNQDSCAVNGTSVYHEVTVPTQLASQANRFGDMGGNPGGICGPHGTCEHKREGQSFWWLKSVNNVDVLDHKESKESDSLPLGNNISNVIEWVQCMSA